MKPCKIIIFQKDIDLRVLNYYNHLASVLGEIEIILVCPNNNIHSDNFPEFITVIHDKMILQRYKVDLMPEYLSMSGWYKQQIIKILTADYLFHLDTKNLLILDGDTFVSSLVFKNQIYLTRKNEPNTYLNMFKFMPSISRFEGVAHLLLNQKISPIVNFGIWNRQVFESVFSRSNNWQKNLVLDISNYDTSNSLATPGFSEYLLMTAATIYNSSTSIGKLRYFRRADLVYSFLINKSNPFINNCRFDVISFEDNHDTNIFKRFLASAAWIFGIEIV